MRIAFISDIHGNYEALLSVIDHIKNDKVDAYICVGDIVGYGANPNECIELVQELNCLCVVAGNHDYAAVNLTDLTYFNPIAYRAILWTQKMLEEKNKKYLETLSLQYSADNYLVVHSSPHNPQDWNYILSLEEAENSFHYFKEQICFIGHSHVPFFVEKAGDNHSKLITEDIIEIKEGCRYLVNVGSVGQPRDNDPRCAFVIYDLEEKKILLKRVEYNIAQAQEKILRAGLPAQLAWRLEKGR